MPFCPAFHLYPGEQVLPCPAGFSAYCAEILRQHLGFQVHARVLCAHEREPDLELQRFAAFAVLECDYGHGVRPFTLFLSGFLPDLVYLVVRYGVEVHFPVPVLVSGKGVAVFLADGPF